MIPAVFGFVLGAVLGSFIQATAGRIISGKTLRGRSYCLSCKHTLRWYDLFPVLSYLTLRGRCRYCHKRIPVEDFLVEIIIATVYALLFWVNVPQSIIYNFQPGLSFTLFLLDLIFKVFITGIFALVFLIDLKSGLIPNVVTYPSTVITIVYLLVSNLVKTLSFYQGFRGSPLAKYLMPPESSYVYDHLLRIWTPLAWTSIAAVTITLIFVLLIVVTKGRGMGWGDVKYVFLLGLALGFPDIIPAIFIAFLSGAVFSLFLILLRKKTFGQTVPFGPFLSLGAIIALLFGTQIIRIYIGIF